MSPRQFNLADLFEVVVDTVPDRPALVAGDRRLTYRQLDERANRFAHFLERRGIGAGAHVGILAHNCAEWAEAMIGCYKARTVPVNLNYRYVASELAYVIDNADLEVPRVRAGTCRPLVADSIGAGHRADRLHLVVIDDGPLRPPAASTVRPPSSTRPPWRPRRPTRTFGPRSPDDVYVLYTGGTTGMPKGVIWRQEDIFFAAMGGGGWGAAPIGTADELADRLDTDDDSRVVMLVVAPLMHGNAQWVMWNAFMMGGTAVLYTDHRYDPDRLWRLIGDEGVVSVGLVGDAMARPLAEALASAPPGTYDTSTLAVIGSGGAMLSATVKDELRKQLPERHHHGQIRIERERRPGSGRGRRHRTPVRDERRHLGARRRVAAPSPRGTGGSGGWPAPGRIPIGYYKDKEKTDATFPVDARRRAVVDPRGPCLGRTRRHHHRPRPGLGVDQLRAARRSSRRRSRPRSRPTRRCSAPSWSGSPTTGSASGWPSWSAPRTRVRGRSDARGHPGALPRPHRRLQDPPSDGGGGRDPPHRGGKARRRRPTRSSVH